MKGSQSEGIKAEARFKLVYKEKMNYGLQESLVYILNCESWKAFLLKLKKNNKLELEMFKHLEKINDHYEFLMYMFLFQINSGTHLLPFDYHRLANLNGILHRLLILSNILSKLMIHPYALVLLHCLYGLKNDTKVWLLGENTVGGGKT